MKMQTTHQKNQANGSNPLVSALFSIMTAGSNG